MDFEVGERKLRKESEVESRWFFLKKVITDGPKFTFPLKL